MSPRDFDPTTVPIKPAATVMLIRDVEPGTGTGVEVFMLRRTLNAVFGSGMYVFPGGRVETSDGLDVDRAHRLAAIRECYEEAGVLLAHDSTGATVVDGHDVLRERVGVNDGSVDLEQLCSRHGLTLGLDDLVWVSHWVTPMGEARRFDTRFYQVPAPVGQQSSHDDTETIDSLWTRPADALVREEQGELMMMPPTIFILKLLSGFDSVDAAMAAVRTRPAPEVILPRLRGGADGQRRGVSIPGDDDYDSLPAD